VWLAMCEGDVPGLAEEIPTVHAARDRPAAQAVTAMAVRRYVFIRCLSPSLVDRCQFKTRRAPCRGGRGVVAILRQRTQCWHSPTLGGCTHPRQRHCRLQMVTTAIRHAPGQRLTRFATMRLIVLRAAGTAHHLGLASGRGGGTHSRRSGTAGCQKFPCRLVDWDSSLRGWTGRCGRPGVRSGIASRPERTRLAGKRWFARGCTGVENITLGLPRLHAGKAMTVKRSLYHSTLPQGDQAAIEAMPIHAVG
jgi:hypothetical protein